jgi:hypothetical protein
MNTDQSERQELPISPARSTASTASTLDQSGDFTQLPFSYKDVLPKRGISDVKADELNLKYNRQSIPLMDDEIFFLNLGRIAAENAPEKVESELQRFIEQESARLHEDYCDAKYDVGSHGPRLLQSDALRFQFVTGIRKQTVHGYEALVAYCLYPLIQAAQKNQPKRRQRAPSSRTLKQPATSKVKRPVEVAGGGGVRRSPRICRDNPRRSTRIKGQKVRAS